MRREDPLSDEQLDAVRPSVGLMPLRKTLYCFDHIVINPPFDA